MGKRAASEQCTGTDIRNQRSRSDNKRYDEHRLNDLLDERHIDPALISMTSEFWLPSLARNTSDPIGRSHAQVRLDSSVVLPVSSLHSISSIWAAYSRAEARNYTAFSKVSRHTICLGPA